MFLEVRKVITILEECCLWYSLNDFLIGLRGGFEKHCSRASLPSFTHSGRSDKTQCRRGKSGRC